MKKNITIIIAALCVLGQTAQAQTMQFLNINPDPESAAVAGTGVSRGANAYALDNNMAASSLSELQFAAEVGYGMWQPKAFKEGVISAAGFAKLGEKLAIGASFKNFGQPEYSITNADGRTMGTFKPSEMAVGLGLSCKLGDFLALGLDAKYASSSIAEEASASSVAADVSLAYSNEGFQFGAAVANLGGKVSYGGESSYSLPAVGRVGASYAFESLKASAQVDYLFSGGLMAGVGAEYTIEEIVSLRAGFHYGDSAKAIPTYASAGLGLNFEGIRLNAAYLLASEVLGGSMMFGLSYTF